MRFADNYADLFTKNLLTSTFEKLVHGIGMLLLNKLNWHMIFERTFDQGEYILKRRIM